MMDKDRKKRLLDLGAETLADALLELASQDDAARQRVEQMIASPEENVRRFKTPTLVTQGEIDYRVPVGQSQQLFTALQERKIPSKLILFPEEGHWIQKPQDSRFWYQQVLEWLAKYGKGS